MPRRGRTGSRLLKVHSVGVSRQAEGSTRRFHTLGTGWLTVTGAFASSRWRPKRESSCWTVLVTRPWSRIRRGQPRFWRCFPPVPNLE